MTLKDLAYRLSIAWRGPNYWHWRHFGRDYQTHLEGDSWHSTVLGRHHQIASVSDWVEPGGTIHIVLSGPSVASIRDPARLARAPTICVNGSFRVLSSVGVRPDLYLLSDGGFVRRRWDTFLEGVAACQSVCADHRLVLQMAQRDGGLLDRHRFRTFDNLRRPFGRSARWWTPARDPEVFIRDAQYAFSTSPRSGYFMSRTVAYLALQIAATQRPRRIVMFGLDLDDGPRYYAEPQPEVLMLHSEYDAVILPHMQFAARILATRNIEVLNASPNSRLPDSVFPKVDPNRFLDDNGG